MEDILIKAAQLILSLSILVVLHELGHFIPAKLFKTKVEKFYLFFDPWFSLFKVQKGETEYGIGWLPLGGYVKISGMIDESMDKEQMKEPPKQWEFRSKPAWQRLIIMVGGVTVNVILGIFIYAMILFNYGERYLPNANLAHGIWTVDSLANEVGFQTGDKITSINGEPVERFESVLTTMIEGGTVGLVRQNEALEVELPQDFIAQLIDANGAMIFYPRIPFTIASIPDSSHNAESGLRERDQVVAVNEKEVRYFDEFKVIGKEFAGEDVALTLIRDGRRETLQVAISADGLLGVKPHIFSHADLEKAGVYNYSYTEFGFFESFPAGLDKAIGKLDFYIGQMKLIFTPSTGAYKGVGGFGSIANLFPATWSWKAFWEITAFLSLILAFMNILPIPALDGGHVMFLLFEMVSGRKPSEKVLEYAQVVGFVILVSLLLFANGNDVFRLFK